MMKGIIVSGALFLATILFVWGAGTVFAEFASGYEVISPKDGVECVVVSRMLNTSVDCWEVKTQINNKGDL